LDRDRPDAMTQVNGGPSVKARPMSSDRRCRLLVWSVAPTEVRELAKPLATQPGAASAPIAELAGTIRIEGAIRRADVTEVCARALGGLAPGGLAPGGLAPGGSPRVCCDLAGLDHPGLPAVEVLARLTLLGRRNRNHFRLEHASPAILDLLVLCGLREVLGGELPPTQADPAAPSGRQMRR
jgi:hypothetical protein